jgi:hypothetical protein
VEAGQCWAACLGLVAGQFYVFVNLESITMVEPVITEGSSAIEGSSSFKSTPRHPIIRGSAWAVLVLSAVSWFWGTAAVWTKYTTSVDTPEAQIDGQLGRPREKSPGGAGSSRWGTAQPEPIVGVQDRERSVTQTANAARVWVGHSFTSPGSTPKKCCSWSARPGCLSVSSHSALRAECAV